MAAVQNEQSLFYLTLIHIFIKLLYNFNTRLQIKGAGTGIFKALRTTEERHSWRSSALFKIIFEKTAKQRQYSRVKYATVIYYSRVKSAYLLTIPNFCCIISITEEREVRDYAQTKNI